VRAACARLGLVLGEGQAEQLLADIRHLAVTLKQPLTDADLRHLVLNTATRPSLAT
jgi:homocitrate synthase NifV